MSEPANSFSVTRWPTEIRLKKAEKALEVDFDDGSTFSFPAELLRVESPSAEVQGHSPDQKKTVSGRRHVGIMEIEPIGNYAICIKFNDPAATEIYAEMGSRAGGEVVQTP